MIHARAVLSATRAVPLNSALCRESGNPDLHGKTHRPSATLFVGTRKEALQADHARIDPPSCQGDIYQLVDIFFPRDVHMSATAKLFRHGRSQALRLPKQYRFEGREVRITKVGDA